MPILITGAAGFIGFHLCSKLIKNDFEVIGFDNINDYYSQELKRDRLKILEKTALNHKGEFKFIKGDLAKKNDLQMVFDNEFFDSKISLVINLAAQAGVRYSLEKPQDYISSNIIGTFNILELCKQRNIKKLIFSSSSSVYGYNKKIQFSNR